MLKYCSWWFGPKPMILYHLLGCTRILYYLTTTRYKLLILASLWNSLCMRLILANIMQMLTTYSHTLYTICFAYTLIIINFFQVEREDIGQFLFLLFFVWWFMKLFRLLSMCMEEIVILCIPSISSCFSSFSLLFHISEFHLYVQWAML